METRASGSNCEDKRLSGCQSGSVRAAFGKGITMKMGQTNVHNYMKPLLERIEKGQIDPSYIISHRISLDEAPEMYKVWRDKEDRVTKIVIDPWTEHRAA